MPELEMNHRGTSRYRGVSWNTSAGKWRATVHEGRTQYSLGFYDTEEEAAEAVKDFRDDI